MFQLARGIGNRHVPKLAEIWQFLSFGTSVSDAAETQSPGLPDHVTFGRSTIQESVRRYTPAESNSHLTGRRLERTGCGDVLLWGRKSPM